MTELRTQRSEKAALTDAAPVGLFRCDERGRMVDVNDAYLAIHGIERAQAADGWLGASGPSSARRHGGNGSCGWPATSRSS